jgi:hypothetical protein
MYVLNCREFWLNYFWLADERFFRPKDKALAKHCHKLYWAIAELLRGHEIVVQVPSGYSLIIEFGEYRESLHLVQDGKRKRNLLGWVDPHPYNTVFRFEEIVAITNMVGDCCHALPAHIVFLLLLGYWGASDQDRPRAVAIGREIARNLRKTKLFGREEVTFLRKHFDISERDFIECEWIKHEKWGWVADCPTSLRCPGSIDIPEGVTFNFALFSRFMDSVGCD